MNELSLIKDEILAFEILLAQQQSANLLKLRALKERTDAMLASFLKSHDKIPSVLDIHIDSFKLTPRTRNCLCRAGFPTLRSIMSSSWSSLMCIEGFGQTSKRELRNLLDSFGIVIPNE